MAWGGQPWAPPTEINAQAPHIPLSQSRLTIPSIHPKRCPHWLIPFEVLETHGRKPAAIFWMFTDQTPQHPSAHQHRSTSVKHGPLITHIRDHLLK